MLWHFREEGLKTNDLIDRADGVKTTVGKEAINDLVGTGALGFVGTGKRNDAKRYWKPEKIQSEPHVVATGTIAESGQVRVAEQPELIRSPIGNGVPTELNISRPQQGNYKVNGQSVDNEERSAIDSVATPTLYKTELNNDSDVERF